MIEITGVIEAIAKENNNGRDKKVLTIKAGNHNLLFVEFQGKSANQVKALNDGDRVSIKVRFNGKISQLGRRHNNIIGKSIKTI